MIATILLALSVMALANFALHYWRAMISGVATCPVSDRIRTAAGLATPDIGPLDFNNILSLNDLAPDLHGLNDSFRGVRMYYAVVKKLGRVVPGVSAWANAEMTTCSRYVAVLMDQHLERNIAYAAQLRAH
jgi:hypothetical protein